MSAADDDNIAVGYYNCQMDECRKEVAELNERLIELHELSKKYDDVCVVNNVNLDIIEHSTVVICGASGSGKTTLLRLIAGLEAPDSGEIYLRNRIAQNSKFSLQPYMRGIGYVFQTPTLWPHMTIKQNIRFGLEGMCKQESEARCSELLEILELTGLEKRYPAQISGGQAKRVALARTLAPRPEILLMDEPLSNIDSRLKSKILDYINGEVRLYAKAILYVTHDRGEGEEIADRIIHMRGGCIEE